MVTNTGSVWPSKPPRWQACLPALLGSFAHLQVGFVVVPNVFFNGVEGGTGPSARKEKGGSDGCWNLLRFNLLAGTHVHTDAKQSSLQSCLGPQTAV